MAGAALLLPFYLIESLVWKAVPVSTTSICAVLAIVFLDERRYRYHLADGALVALGLYLAAVKRRATTPGGDA